jgi:hypothetical protein
LLIIENIHILIKKMIYFLIRHLNPMNVAISKILIIISIMSFCVDAINKFYTEIKINNNF